MCQLTFKWVDSKITLIFTEKNSYSEDYVWGRLETYFEFRAQTHNNDWIDHKKSSKCGMIRYSDLSTNEFYDRWKLETQYPTTVMTVTLSGDYAKDNFELMRFLAHGLIDEKEMEPLLSMVFKYGRPAWKKDDLEVHELKLNYDEWQESQHTNRLGGLRYRKGEDLPQRNEMFLREPGLLAFAIVNLMPFGSTGVLNHTFPMEIWCHLLSFLQPSSAPPIGNNDLKSIGYIMIRRCLIETLEQYINRRGTLYHDRAIMFIEKVYFCRTSYALMMLVKNEFKLLKTKKPCHGATPVPGMFALFMLIKSASSKTEDQFITILNIFTKKLSGNEEAKAEQPKKVCVFEID